MIVPSISLLLPTRGRRRHVERLLAGVAATTADLTRLEIVAYVDCDDVESHGIAHRAIRVQTLIRPPGATMGTMMRACYDVSRGRYVMLINDDVVFRTAGWDLEVIRAFTRFADDVALVYGNDLDQQESRPTFPIVSRAACDVIGSICPRGYYGLHIESHLFDIFKRLVALGADRIVYLDDVVFEHTHYARCEAGLKATYRHRNKVDDDVLFFSLDQDRCRSARRLHRFITDPARLVRPAAAANI